jgi:site-specific recombinase XerD
MSSSAWTLEPLSEVSAGSDGQPTSARQAESRALAGSDHAALLSLQEALAERRQRGDRRPSFPLIADCLEKLGIALPERRPPAPSLEQARWEWLRRQRSANRSASTLTAYRVAIDDLFDFLAREPDRDPFCEETIVAYLEDYHLRKRPAESTYYRRFTLLRRFFRWLSRRSGVPDPFLDLEPPAKRQREADWLTVEEFARLLAAAGSPRRHRPGLAERDRLVLLTLVTTGLRRSELLALDWGDLDLDAEQPSLLVRCGKGGKPRRQPLPAALAREFARVRDARQPSASDPVFCGLAGGRLWPTILAGIVRRAAERAGLEKHVTVHTLRHTAATWLRQETGDARLVAAYLGHADLSTVSRYTHVAEPELYQAAEAIAGRAGLGASSPFSAACATLADAV